MLASDAEIIYNWRNELRQKNEGVRVVAAQSAKDLKKSGYSAKEALEMLASDYDLGVAEAAVYEVYATHITPPKVKTAMVVPSSYSDVKPIIEQSLEKLSAKEFINKLAKSELPILKVSEKSLNSLYRLANDAKSDRYAMDMLHSELKPWIEEAMLKSVLISESEEFNIQKTSSANTYRVAMRKEEAEVDLSAGTSTGSRFNKGNFGDFGIADEFMIKAAAEISPYERLQRVLSN